MQTTASVSGSHCRKIPLAGVYNPQRLEVKDPCKTVSGTVEKIRHEKDGDYHVNLKLDSQYTELINEKNKTKQKGDLVVEIIPMDQSKIPAPKVGQHISVTGAYVLDKQHGWMEIHPAWIVDGKGSPDYDKTEAEKSAASPTDDETETDAAKTSANKQTESSSSVTKDNKQESASAPVPQSQATVKIISVTSPVKRNSYATLKAKVPPGATAYIEVDYQSGPSNAAGLEPKTAGSNGIVSWTWKVGGHTTIGTWPVTVTVNGMSTSTQIEVVH
jgi:hypothetical protein